MSIVYSAICVKTKPTNSVGRKPSGTCSPVLLLLKYVPALETDVESSFVQSPHPLFPLANCLAFQRPSGQNIL